MFPPSQDLGSENEDVIGGTTDMYLEAEWMRRRGKQPPGGYV